MSKLKRQKVNKIVFRIFCSTAIEALSHNGNSHRCKILLILLYLFCTAFYSSSAIVVESNYSFSSLLGVGLLLGVDSLPEIDSP
jgi:hypothetical protein